MRSSRLRNWVARRVDVTLRISGSFRDAFPAQIELFDKAVRAIGCIGRRCEAITQSRVRMWQDEAMH